MQAFYITDAFNSEVREITTPEPRAGHLLLRVYTVGLCGSDLATYRGKNRMVTYPRIPGHEIGAVIEKVAPDISEEWQPGMPVTVMPYSHCGHCPACRRGRVNACENNQTLGVQRDGAICEFIEAPVEMVHAAAKLSFRELALVEPLAVGGHAARRAETEEGSTVAVFGCGAIGLGVIATAAYRGAHVIAIDIENEKLRTARALGASDTINTTEIDPIEALREKTDGEGPDAVIEAIGLPQTFRQAVEAVACTGRVVYVGYASEAVTYDTSLFVKKELDIRGARNALKTDFQEVIGMLERQFIDISPLITNVAGLAETGQALQHWHENTAQVRKILIDVAQAS